MKVPAWEIWSSEDSWGMRELDTRKIREGASIEEAGHDMVWQIDMGCLPEKSDGNDAWIVGDWLKGFAWQVAVPQLLADYRTVRASYDKLSAEVDIHIELCAGKNRTECVEVDE